MKWSDLQPGDQVMFTDSFAQRCGFTESFLRPMTIRAVTPKRRGRLQIELWHPITSKSWPWIIEANGCEPYIDGLVFKIVGLADDNAVE